MRGPCSSGSSTSHASHPRFRRLVLGPAPLSPPLLTGAPYTSTIAGAPAQAHGKALVSGVRQRRLIAGHGNLELTRAYSLPASPGICSDVAASVVGVSTFKVCHSTSILQMGVIPDILLAAIDDLIPPRNQISFEDRPASARRLNGPAPAPRLSYSSRVPSVLVCPPPRCPAQSARCELSQQHSESKSKNESRKLRLTTQNVEMLVPAQRMLVESWVAHAHGQDFQPAIYREWWAEYEWDSSPI
jgi:hypothetical protein